jgi:adenylate cyclase
MHVSLRLRFLLYSLAAWHFALGMLVLVRRTGATEETADWVPTGPSLLLAWLLCGSLFGLTYWLVTLVAETSRFRSRPYLHVIVLKSVVMLGAVAVYYVLSRLIAVLTSELTLADAWTNVLQRLTDPLAGVFLIFVAVVSVMITLLRQMAIMVGPRVLFNLLLGKYHQPKTENRIFMFLDLEGSTGHAERLGHEVFCRLIQECFRDLTGSAIQRRVEIYQYVGDEAILTWLPHDGLRDTNCLRVYFDFQQALKARSGYYQREFGFVPRFKAGVNMGPVTAAEVGVLKRDIAYLSDVLNTAARLESLCREYRADLLVAATVREALLPTPEFHFQLVGNLTLRGKSELVDVYRVTPGATPADGR